MMHPLTIDGNSKACVAQHRFIMAGSFKRISGITLSENCYRVLQFRVLKYPAKNIENTKMPKIFQNVVIFSSRP